MREEAGREKVEDVFKRVWADLVEPGGGAGKAVGGGARKGWLSVARGGRSKSREGEREESRRRGACGLSRWPAVGDWSKAAAVVSVGETAAACSRLWRA